MDTGEAAAVIDVGLLMMSISASFADDVQRWHIAVPRDAAVTLTSAELLLPGGKHSVALDRLLHMVVKIGQLATMAHVVVLARSWVQPLFYTYVLRWLRAMVPMTTAVSQLPRALFAVQCAGIKSALVVQCDNGVLFCTPVLDGVISAELESVWGDVGTCATVDVPLMEDCFREVGTRLIEVMRRDSCDVHRMCDSRGTCPTAQQLVSLNCAEDMYLTVKQHVALCQMRELRPCLATVVLCGDSTALPAARQCIALLVSAWLPDSVLTWV
ncbi:hypothetical protein Q4I28_004634 [Leishmania naiffi]|uniref:Uncharacterized protein n=1 Tax=Leishmania naiffi TaxID=5678 RepID=A0AAW3BKU7_9TRYP